MRFFTAVFGDTHLRAGLALERSFRRYHRGSELLVFTDQPSAFRAGVESDWSELLAPFPPLYHQSVGGLRNVFKISLLAEMQQRFPLEVIVWLDADMLVFDDLRRHLVEGVVNVVAHGRRDGEVVDCGDGLMVPGERYAISGCFALPHGPALTLMRDFAFERPSWDGDGGGNRSIGDQLILNHLIHRSGLPVRWMTDDRRFIYNLELADGLHPDVGDPRLHRIRWRGGPRLAGRRIVVWYWIKNKLDRHMEEEFRSFRPSVRRRLMDLYSP